MCIRDSFGGGPFQFDPDVDGHFGREVEALFHAEQGADIGCLLYTSDAADERSSVDLGGRRIIKKKKSSNDNDATGQDTGQPARDATAETSEER